MWATRIFRTRSLSSDACKRNRISVNSTIAKPSREIKVNDKIQIKNPSYTKTLRVVGILNNRVGAKIVSNYILDLTPEEEYEKDKQFRKNYSLVSYSSSNGRPSKKQRRNLDEFLSQNGNYSRE